jgi:hypothetical protein
VSMTEAESTDVTGKTVNERLERLEDRVQQVEIDVREAKGIGLEARTMAMQARDRALLAFGHAETDPALDKVEVPQVGEPEAYAPEDVTAALRAFATPHEPVDPLATIEQVREAAERHGATVLDGETTEHLVATLAGVRDAMDLAVGAFKPKYSD